MPVFAFGKAIWHGMLTLTLHLKSLMVGYLGDARNKNQRYHLVYTPHADHKHLDLGIDCS